MKTKEIIAKYKELQAEAYESVEEEYNENALAKFQKFMEKEWREV